VPLGEKLFTVGEPLPSDAVLIKGRKSVGLVAFRTGDRVTVKWEVTEHGQGILMLRSKEPPFDLTSTLFYYPLHRSPFYVNRRVRILFTRFKTGAEMPLPLPSNWI